jgi:hypothetical protein
VIACRNREYGPNPGNKPKKVGDELSPYCSRFD